MPSKTTGKLAVADFIQHSAVVSELDNLKKRFDPALPGGKPLVVSDVLDADGHQYVNLVQKGGGVFGIALVGYTYVLEEMGIRFLRLAGTSAGAINTALITVIKNKQDKKSSEVLQAICDLDFFSLVDGHPAARSIIKNFITQKDYLAKARNKLLGVLAAFALLVAGDVILVGLSSQYPALYVWTGLCFILTGFLSLILGIGVAYFIDLFKRLKNSGYGINPGDVFYDWIKGLLLQNNVATVSELNEKAADCPPLQLRVPNESGLADLKGDVTFIASELVTQNKIQFPAMCTLFRTDIDTLPPAGFIRASMSIPIFFESYMINDIPTDDPRIQAAWKQYFGMSHPPATARFVDGGILSNFPISIFYNANVTVPRLPSFGIDLDDSKPADKEDNAFSWSLTGYFGRMFNTIRNYYDKDFLLKNEVYQRGVGKVDMSDDKYNWLNFFLSDEDKIDMFVQGVKAAVAFLNAFDWDAYKNDRTAMQIQLKK
ncbi:patatin-like phospholipase family protein [Chitinophaga arvensicola]|uniref:NTE family protein n=1 Tax=Chitinophaga arvensicola TaxID=29529 RepID=A0A1I0S7G3_9BACT|nr:patatin-like phospholipase family protein [Chitinophaga arvensicola]SEW51675.1 NTE family protein [Chitinophaga arvensicola]